MEAAKIIDKHDEQIEGIKESLGDITTKLTVMISEHEHLSQKVEEILITVKLFKDSEVKVRILESEVERLGGGLEKVTDQSRQTAVEVQEIKSRPSISKFFNWLKKYWYLYVIVAPALGGIMEILYKMDPHK